jgi:hypothetical protein
MTTIVDDAREKILAATGHGLDSLFGGLVLPRTGCQRTLLILRREARRWEGRLVV